MNKLIHSFDYIRLLECFDLLSLPASVFLVVHVTQPRTYECVKDERELFALVSWDFRYGNNTWKVETKNIPASVVTCENTCAMALKPRLAIVFLLFSSFLGQLFQLTGKSRGYIQQLASCQPQWSTGSVASSCPSKQLWSSRTTGNIFVFAPIHRL